MKLFLDDIRIPEECSKYMHTRIGSLNPIYLDKWEIVRNFEEFQLFITTYCKEITHVSFDHDLGDEHYAQCITDDNFLLKDEDIILDYSKFKEKSGYDCALWMKEHYQLLNLPLPTIIVHSMNPVGRINIENLFK